MKVRIIKEWNGSAFIYYLSTDPGDLGHRKEVFEIPDKKARAWKEVQKWYFEIQDSLEDIYNKRTT
jgi:hypothetical protein